MKIIKFAGDRQSAQLDDGRTVYREDKLWMGRDWKFVKCPSTGPHFIFHDPDFNPQTGDWPLQPNGFPYPKYIGRRTPLCTCGSFGVVVGSKAYEPFASPTTRADSTTPGQMLMCLALVQTGKHLDGSHD